MTPKPTTMAERFDRNWLHLNYYHESGVRLDAADAVKKFIRQEVKAALEACKPEIICNDFGGNCTCTDCDLEIEEYMEKVDNYLKKL